MHDLAPLTALGAETARNDTVGALRIDENPDIAIASAALRRGQQDAGSAALAKWLGASLPAPGKAHLGDPRSALWTGPDQWLLMTPYTAQANLAEELAGALSGMASVTEQSDAWVVFDVSGAGVVDMAERLVPAPVRRMQRGDAQRSILHHIGCFVLCLDAGRHLRILGPRSSAGSLHHALIAAARSVA